LDRDGQKMKPFSEEAKAPENSKTNQDNFKESVGCKKGEVHSERNSKRRKVSAPLRTLADQHTINLYGKENSFTPDEWASSKGKTQIRSQPPSVHGSMILMKTPETGDRVKKSRIKIAKLAKK
jgi:hypothetical protein